MRVLICAIIFAICGCCHTKIAAPCPENAIQQPQIDVNAGARQQVNDAWTEAANEELISAIEKSDSKQWIRDIKRRLVLAETYEVGIYLHRSGHGFSRMTVFWNGALFLDGEEQNISTERMNRLARFYDKTTHLEKQP
jgi:hypothetical protein